LIAFLSASILGSVTTIIIKLYQGAEELKEMKQSIDDFIKHHRISKQLAKRMQDSFEHEWKNTKGIDMNNILKTFPECIQADICLHLNRELLHNCPVFEDASEGKKFLNKINFSSFFFFSSCSSCISCSFQINSCSTR
jgi:hypothetical protein